MAAIGTETIPTAWDADSDVAFFTITAPLFSVAFTYGAGVLLASYDSDDATVEGSSANALDVFATPARPDSAGAPAPIGAQSA